MTAIHSGPRDVLDVADAISCDATATHQVGDHAVCETHRLEVARAVWGVDSGARMTTVDPTVYAQCGDILTEVSA